MSQIYTKMSEEKLEKKLQHAVSQTKTAVSIECRPNGLVRITKGDESIDVFLAHDVRTITSHETLGVDGPSCLVGHSDVRKRWKKLFPCYLTIKTSSYGCFAEYFFRDTETRNKFARELFDIVDRHIQLKPVEEKVDDDDKLMKEMFWGTIGRSFFSAPDEETMEEVD